MRIGRAAQYLAAVALVIGSLSLAACASHGRGERAGRAVDRTVDRADRKADQVGDEIEDGADRTKDKLERAGEELKK